MPNDAARPGPRPARLRVFPIIARSPYCSGAPHNDQTAFGLGSAWIDLGGQQLHLSEAESPPILVQDLAVQVGELDAVEDELRSKGVEVTDAFPVGPNHSAFLCEPAGNGGQLHEVGSAPTRPTDNRASQWSPPRASRSCLFKRAAVKGDVTLGAGQSGEVEEIMTVAHQVLSRSDEAMVNVDRTVVMNLGEVIAEGDFASVMADPGVRTAYLGVQE